MEFWPSSPIFLRKKGVVADIKSIFERINVSKLSKELNQIKIFQFLTQVHEKIWASVIQRL